MWIIHSGLLNFSVALIVAVLGIMTWNIGRSVPVAVMNVGLVLLNIGFGIFNVLVN